MEILYWLSATVLGWYLVAFLLKGIIGTTTTKTSVAYKRPNPHMRNRYSEQFQRQLHRENMERFGNFY